ncbi:MAG: transglycosylase SLT domain-containing protein [Chitinophagales bacterium]|nr:transglycosylase SLT domain-containing protein [Chitinophagales bacterium]
MFCGAASVAQDAIDSNIYKFDTEKVVIRKGIEPAKMLLAARLPEFMPKVYKHVPLALDTIYFGEKIEAITDYTEKYLRSHNRTLATVQDRAEAVFPMIDGIMEQNKLPKELKYLAVIESALNNHARSRVGAVGPWQFMSYTGREMGLVVNKYRDDRKDWLRSTNAAVKYLKELYEDLDDWLLVIAAYNSGPRPVLRAIQRTGSTNYWDIKPYLPKETQNHVLAFVATATIFERLDFYIGSELPDNISYTRPVKTPKVKAPSYFTEEDLKNMAIVRIDKPINFSLMAQELGIDIDILRKWNGDYQKFELNIYCAKEYKLRIPKDSLDKFLEKKSSLAKRSEDIYSSQNM